MARRRRSRRSYRKGRWSANIKQISYQDDTELFNGNFYSSLTICSNPIQSDNTVSQQYTVKNIQLALTVEANNTTILNYVENLIGYIMYVPQGMNVTSSYPFQHPEYIMAYRYYGSPAPETSSPPATKAYPLRVRSRLARRLQTGDSIIFLLTGFGQDNPGIDKNLQINGLVCWWTKAN